ncbi:hypothetical protein BurJ1DRAFT_2618 [Burkholderiales bacterium JOSHI_001]|nr:hypothetical protein BurJ1DRAFT_2618 [Burkholderiales bacterium JOSHI_001]
MAHPFVVGGRRALALALLCLVGACGGGGGSSSPDPNGNAGGTDQQPANNTLSGHLLYSTSVPTDQTYLGSADASSIEIAVTSDPDPVAWPDASQYLEYTLGGAGTDQINVFNSANRQLLYQVQVPSFCGRLRASPVSKTQVLGQCFQSLLSNQGILVVIDLAGSSLVHSEPDQPKRYKYRWLPDGTVLRVHDETGAIAKATVGGAWQTLGQLSVPSNRRVQALEVNVQGTRLAMTFREYSDFANETPSTVADLWVANLNGSAQERVTSNGNVYAVQWSPDGSKLAFNVDTSSCGDASACGGTSSWWVAASSARNLQSLVAGVAHASAAQLQRRFPSGNVTPLVGTDLMAWLP